MSELREQLPTLAREQEEAREALADLMHQIWGGWMKYLFSKCEEFNGRGYGNHIPPSWADRWTRQMNTPYADLPEQEKDADRAEADRVLALLRKAIWPRESK